MGKPLIRMFYDLIEDVRLLWPGSHLYAGPVVARIVVSGGQGEGVLRGRKKGTQGEEQQLFRHSSRPIKMIYSRESFLAFQGTSHREPTLSLTSHSHRTPGAQMAFDFPPPNLKKKTFLSLENSSGRVRRRGLESLDWMGSRDEGSLFPLMKNGRSGE